MIREHLACVSSRYPHTGVAFAAYGTLKDVAQITIFVTCRSGMYCLLFYSSFLALSVLCYFPVSLVLPSLSFLSLGGVSFPLSR